MKMRRAFLGVAAVVFLMGIIPGNARAVITLNPDLIALESSEVQVSWEGTRKLLRFTTTSWNAGSGPFELVAKPNGQPANGDRVPVEQRIYAADGSYVDVELPSMSFEWHGENHNHWHLEGYAKYYLVAEDGSRFATGQKTSFCIMDTDRIDHRLSGAPKRPAYRQCGTDIQGMSVGWGDSYRYYLGGQSLDITDWPDGQYTLTIEIDPLHKFMEADAGSSSAEDPNNSSTVTLMLSGDSVIVVGAADGGGNGRSWCDEHPGHSQWDRRCG